MTEKDDRRIPPTAPQGHEPEGVRVNRIVTVVMVLLASLVVIYFGVDLLGHYQVGHLTSVPRPETDLFALRQPPSGPKGTDTLAVERERLAAEQLGRLESYGWVDRAAGLAHVPVSDALEVAASRGLPRFDSELPAAERRGK